MKAEESSIKGEILSKLVAGEWYEFNDGKQFLHSIVLMKIEKSVKIVLLLEDLKGKINTLVFDATANESTRTSNANF